LYARTFCNTSSPWAEKFLGVREVLGFIAPWNDKGYKIAKYFRDKFTSVSPLWFRILPGRPDTVGFDIAGLELAQKRRAWANDSASVGLGVLPHFSIEGFERLEGLRALLAAPETLASEMVGFCQRGGFAGLVFDIRIVLFPGVKKLMPQLVAAVGQALRAAGKRFVLSVPAPVPGDEGSKRPVFDAADSVAVAANVDAVVVGTRDFSKGEAGPAAPLPWVRSSLMRLLAGAKGGGLRADQLLLEVPLYGRAFRKLEEGRVAMGDELVKVVKREKPLFVWDAEAREHSANISRSQVVLSLPTLQFVAERLKLAKSLGVGVALRELGSGVDYLYDLLPVSFAAKLKRLAAKNDGAGVSTHASEL